MSAKFNRPGVSDEFLERARCHHVGHDECARLYGFRAEGIAIPFADVNGSAITDTGRPFARVRLYEATDDQKYHQRPGSGIHVFVPHTFGKSAKSSRLILVEGEFKALALVEAGYVALGLCGFNGAARTVGGVPGNRDHALNDELVDLLKIHQPAELVFLGDADVALNAQFAVEAAKLRRILFASKQFRFVERFTVVKLPLTGPKGADDLREEKGKGFNEHIDVLLSNGHEVPQKASATEIFVTLLKREKKSVKKLLLKEDHDGARARVRLLQSAAQLWNETGARLELKPLLADMLGVKQSEVAGLVKDAAAKKQGNKSDEKETADNAQGSAVKFPELELWETPVDGAEVLADVAETVCKYVVLPDGAADAIALWVAHAHVVNSFLHTPRLNIQSPDKRCGKTTLRDVTATLVPKPLPTENLSTAVLFRVVDKHQPTLLADECDSWIYDNEDLRGMLNAGHKRGGQALRCVGDEFEPRAFQVFAPVVLAGIGTLPGTLHDRSIVIRLSRAKPGEVRVGFDSRRIQTETQLCRKLARWSADNFENLKNCDPQLPSGAFNRLADNWRPLFAIAEIAGGDWPQRAADAFTKLMSREDSDAQGIRAALLADIADTFTASDADKLRSAEITDALTKIEGREWAEWGKARKPISPNQLAKLLRPFNISPRTIKLPDGSTAKGYHREDFHEAFERYLPQSPSSNRNPVTTPKNIDDSALSETSPAQNRLRIENVEIANRDTEGDAVTVQKAEKLEGGALLL